MPTNKVNIPTYRLIGKNYTTPDLIAKVTGKAKYAEDFRAEGMLFCKLLLSPMPHARVKHIDLSAALAMPGVKAILTADDLPAPAAFITDDGVMIPPNPKAERGQRRRIGDNANKRLHQRAGGVEDEQAKRPRPSITTPVEQQHEREQREK